MWWRWVRTVSSLSTRRSAISRLLAGPPDISSGEKTWMSPLGRIGCFSARQRADRQPPDHLRPAEDPVPLDQELVLAAIREPGQRAPPALDRLSRDGLDRLCAERRQQVRVERRAVVVQRRGLALPVLLDEAQPLSRRVREGRAGPEHPRQRPATGLV